MRDDHDQHQQYEQYDGLDKYKFDEFKHNQRDHRLDHDRDNW